MADVNHHAFLEMSGYPMHEAKAMNILDLSLGESPCYQMAAEEYICCGVTDGAQIFE